MYNGELANNFSLPVSSDCKLTLSLEGGTKEMRHFILDNIFLDVPKSDWCIHALMPDDNINSLNRIITFRRKKTF